MRVFILFIVCLGLGPKLLAQNIHRTACQGNLARLDSMLVDAGIHAKDYRGRSLLHWAVACKQKEVFDFLVQKGIPINGTDHQEKTPLHVAVQYDNTAYLDYLLKLQPNRDWASKQGASLLELAVLRKNKSIVEKLIGEGVPINSANHRGSTPLEIAQRIGADELSEYLISQGADQSLVRQFKMKGEYMGQERPKTTPKLFAPNFISTEEQEFSCAFNAAGTEFYFGVDVFGKNEIRYSKREGKHWSKPKTIISHERYSYNDPFLSNDEQRLYFISTQTLNGEGKPKDVDIWYVERTDDGWSKPINAGTNINTQGNEYYISFTNTGTLYFSSNGHQRQDTTRTDHDIYYSKFMDNLFQKPVLLGNAINSTAYEADVFVAPDESYIIFCSERDNGFGRGDLYISFKQSDNTWSKAVNMGNAINTQNYEYCPFVSKDGKYLFYTSNQDIYWVSTELIRQIKENGN